MKLDFGDYRITTDERQFVIQQKRIIEEGKLTKKENVGKERWVDIAYCPSLKFSLKFLYTKTLLDNDDLMLIMKKLHVIENKIAEFLKVLKQEAEYVDKRMYDCMKARVIQFEKLEGEMKSLKAMKDELEVHNLRFISIGNSEFYVESSLRKTLEDNLVSCINERLEQIQKEMEYHK